jgi:hypothetical protein
MARGIDVVRKYDLPANELEQKVAETFAEFEGQDVERHYEESVREFEPDTILMGKVLNVVNQEVIVDIGYKSEGVIPLWEFGENADVDVGDEIEVLLDEIEDETGMIRLSKRKAARIRAWNQILETHKEGDVVRGVVLRKIKGGLLRRAMSCAASSCARSRAACSWTSACRCSCRPARSRCGGPRTSASSSARRSRRASSRSTSSA